MGRPPRIGYLAIALTILAIALGLQAGGVVTVGAGGPPSAGESPAPAPSPPPDPIEHGSLPNDLPPGSTLVSVQSYDDFANSNGRAYIVGPDGEELWSWDPPNHRVFHAELLEDGTVLVAAAREVPDPGCPTEYRDRPRDHCVENRVLVLDYETKEPIFEYAWWDSFIEHHEVHDATMTNDGDVAVIDMGRNRAFTVTMDGELSWEWDAVEHLGEGSPFHDEYGGPRYDDRYQDWTHMNDIDQLDNGNFQLSIRNFNVIIEVDPTTDEIVDVIGHPERTDLLNHQHNPQRLPERGTLLVADSENDRVVELDMDSESVVWQYGGDGELRWPRDADRLPNGHTVIVDTLHFRVIEVTMDGRVIWEHAVRHPNDRDREMGLGYSAHRLSVDGEFLPHERSAGRDGAGGRTRTPSETMTPVDQPAGEHEIVGSIRTVEAWAKLYFGDWVTVPAILTALATAFVGLWLVMELALHERRRQGGR